MNQVVMDMEIELIAASLVARAAAGPAQWRRMKLNGAASEIVMNMVSANVNMIGISAEIHRVIKL